MKIEYLTIVFIIIMLPIIVVYSAYIRSTNRHPRYANKL